jgi:hypothetical protein
VAPTSRFLRAHARGTLGYQTGECDSPPVLAFVTSLVVRAPFSRRSALHRVHQRHCPSESPCRASSWSRFSLDGRDNSSRVNVIKGVNSLPPHLHVLRRRVQAVIALAVEGMIRLTYGGGGGSSIPSETTATVQSFNRSGSGRISMSSGRSSPGTS